MAGPRGSRGYSKPGASAARVSLASGSDRTWDPPRNFRTGLGLIALVIRRAGCDVRVIKVRVEGLSRDAAVGWVAAHDPDVVGFGGPMTTYSYASRNTALPQHVAHRPMRATPTSGEAPPLGLHLEPCLSFCRFSDVGNSVQRSTAEAEDGELRAERN